MQRSSSSIARSCCSSAIAAIACSSTRSVKPREALEPLLGARDRVRRTPARAQRLDHAAHQRRRELVAVAIGQALQQLPGALELGERRLRFVRGGILGAEVVVQERRRRAFGLLQAQQLDVAARLLAAVAHSAEIAVVLDAHAACLDALGQVAGQAVGDLLVQAPLEAVLGPVAKYAQRVVRDGGAVLEIAGVVGLREVERLAPGAPGERAQQRSRPRPRAPRRRPGRAASRPRPRRRRRCAPAAKEPVHSWKSTRAPNERAISTVASVEPVSTITISSTASATAARQRGSISCSSRTIMHRLRRMPVAGSCARGDLERSARQLGERGMRRCGRGRRCAAVAGAPRARPGCDPPARAADPGAWRP